MRWRFVFRLAAREARSAVPRVGTFLASITLGVGALVAIHSFKADVQRSVEEEAQALLGADLRISGDEPFGDPVLRLVDSLVAEGARSSAVTTTPSMVLAPRSDRVRLLQVRGVDGGYPFYRRRNAGPAPDAGGRDALVDPTVLTQLAIRRGDSVEVGGIRLAVADTLTDPPADLGFRTALGARVQVSGETLRESGLLAFGSLVRYELYVQLPDPDDQDVIEERYEDLIREERARLTTARERADDLTDAVAWLGGYLGLVGLGALLLGGIGVASAIQVFVRERTTTVAVLRCLGARQNEAFLVYLILAGGLALVGSVLGAVLGVGVQTLLPRTLAQLPLDVVPRLSPLAAVGGVAIGFWVAVVFALTPLLRVRDVPPLSALRSDFEGERSRRPDPLTVLALASLLASVVVLSVMQAPDEEEGLAFAVGVTAAAGALWLLALLITRAARAFFPKSAAYPVRQGIANLFRPRNQTLTVTLALGFGAFVVGTLLQVEASLVDELRRGTSGQDQPSLVLFDVQPDQTEGVLGLIPPAARATAEVTAMVPARIARLRGRTPQEILNDTTDRRAERWAVRREYRHTFRERLTESEELVAGRWFDALPPRQPGDPARVSMETDLATSLDVVVGDTVVWDFAGREVPSVVTSLRFVDWGRLSTNFFVVFEPGTIEEAPRMDVVLLQMPDPLERAQLQRSLVDVYPTVSAIDVQQVQEAIGRVLSKVESAVRLLALACALAGLLVLGGSLATSREQRTREAALLRTLGARRGQLLGVLVTEYAALGTTAALAGLLLAGAAAAWVTSRVLELDFRLHLPSLALVWTGVSLLTVVTGLLASRSVLRRPPLPVLRELPQ